MSQASAHAGQDDTATGRVILVVSSALAALLVIAGLFYAAGTGPRHAAALAAAGCEPGQSPSGQPCTTTQMLVRRYLAIMTPAGQQLNADMLAYSASESGNLKAAQAALTAEVATDQAFGAGLGGLEFPPSVAPLARTLVQDNRARAALSTAQARSTSLTQLRSYDHRAQVANAAVRADMKAVLNALRAS